MNMWFSRQIGNPILFTSHILPSTIHRDLFNIKCELKLMQRVTSALDAERQRLEIAELRARNASQLVMRLPREILCDIFLRAAIRSNRFVQDQTRPLTSICHCWRQLAVKCPALWSKVHLAGHPRIPFDRQEFQIRLKRSQGACLDVYVSIEGSPKMAGYESIARSLEELSGQASRFRSLILRVDFPEPLSIILPLRGNLQHLGSLEIELYDAALNGAPWKVVADDDISSLTLPLNLKVTPASAINISSFQSINIASLDVEDSEESSSVLPLLSLFGNLLRLYWSINTTPLQLPTSTRIQLPYLRELDIDGGFFQPLQLVPLFRTTRLRSLQIWAPHKLLTPDFTQILLSQQLAGLVRLDIRSVTLDENLSISVFSSLSQLRILSVIWLPATFRSLHRLAERSPSGTDVPLHCPHLEIFHIRIEKLRLSPDENADVLDSLTGTVSRRVGPKKLRIYSYISRAGLGWKDGDAWTTEGQSCGVYFLGEEIFQQRIQLADKLLAPFLAD